MNKKDILIGFFVGITAALFGLIFAIQIFGKSDDWEIVIKQAISQGFLTKLMSIGALLNLGAFFLFIKRNEDQRAKGVLIATILVLVSTMIIKFMN
jgi:formate-dependent nitrite reductase membrane component NrfD